MEIDFKEYAYEKFYVLGHTRSKMRVAVSDELTKEDIREKIEEEYNPDFEFDLENQGEYNEKNTRWKITTK